MQIRQAEGLFIVVAILYKIDADHVKISDTQSATKGSVSLATKTASLWEGICIWCEKVFVFDVRRYLYLMWEGICTWCKKVFVFDVVRRFSCLCFLWAGNCANVYVFKVFPNCLILYFSEAAATSALSFTRGMSMFSSTKRVSRIYDIWWCDKYAFIM